MKAVVQRVLRASISVEDEIVSEIGAGALILLGVAKGDRRGDASYLARKTRKMRIFDDENGKMNNPIDSLNGSFLVVSQFTLCGDCRKGNRPSYRDAAPASSGKMLYEQFLADLRRLWPQTKSGVFGAEMMVSFENQGPVTLILESSGRERG